MEDKSFLVLKKTFLQNKDIKELSKSNFFILLDLLFLSFEWHHKPFFRTVEDTYKDLNIDKMAFSRFRDQTKSLNISIIYKNKRYYFDLSVFFEIYSPLGNKTVTINDKSNSNRTVTQEVG
jgi:hypothetical protein